MLKVHGANVIYPMEILLDTCTFLTTIALISKNNVGNTVKKYLLSPDDY
jgi:hypothetical protein